MRVCLVALDFPPFRSSGLTVYAESLVQGLLERGHQVTVVAAQRPAGQQVDAGGLPPAPVVRVPLHRLDWIGLGWEAGRYLRAHGGEFDVVHFADVHFAYASRRPYVASAFQSFRQRLTSDHGRPYSTGRRNLLFRMAYYRGAMWGPERRALRRASHILMSSQATQAEFLGHYGLDPARASVVYPGTDLRRLAGQLPGREAARQALGLANERPLLLYIGFSTPRKGVEYLGAALRQMSTPAGLAMLGKWEAGYQERFLGTLGPAAGRVRLAGYVGEAEKMCYLAAADALVLPTLLEGFGIPLVEAMAAGLPVVTTAAGSAGEVVGDAGLVVPPADAAALAAALDRLLGSQALADELRRRGRERAYGLFDLPAATARVEAVYQAAMGRVRTGPGGR